MHMQTPSQRIDDKLKTRGTFVTQRHILALREKSGDTREEEDAAAKYRPVREEVNRSGLSVDNTRRPVHDLILALNAAPAQLPILQCCHAA